MEAPRSKREILANIEVIRDLAATPQYALQEELILVQELSARDQLIYLLGRIRGVAGITESHDEKLLRDRRVLSHCLSDVRQFADVALDNPLVKISTWQRVKFYGGLLAVTAAVSWAVGFLMG
jgi:hypothetical protein